MSDQRVWEEGTGRDTALSCAIRQSSVRIHTGRTKQTQQENDLITQRDVDNSKTSSEHF